MNGPARTIPQGLRPAVRSVRRLLAPTLVGSAWRTARRWRRRLRVGLGGRARVEGRDALLTSASVAQPARRDGGTDLPREPYPLDLSVFDVDPDPDRAAAILAGAFGHGYLVTTDRPELPGFLEAWATTAVGPLWLRSAPRTVVTIAEQGDATAVVIGHPVHVDRGTTDAGAIARSRAGQLHAGHGDHAPAVRKAAYLAGRWTVLLHTRVAGTQRGRLTVVPDTMGTQPVFYATAAGRLALGSADTLVAVVEGLPVDHVAQRLAREIRELKPTGVVYLPGRVTNYVGVEQLVPNCLLAVDLDTPSALRHERFWPFVDRVEEPDLDVVHEEFADRLRRQLRLLPELGRLSWSLTGGGDSRVLLAHQESPPPPGTFAFTYLNPRDAATNAGAVDDVFVANALAFRVGMPHRVLRWRQAAPDSVFGRLHTATFPVSYNSHGAAHAMWADLPHDLVQVQGLGGEIGTVFRTDRPPGPLTPAKAANMWLGPAFEQHPGFRQIFEEYLAYSSLDDARLRGYNHHDILYWEHRMGRWGWKKSLVGDFSHRIVPPLNDRRTLEVMLSLPEPQRVGKALYQRVLQGAPLLQVD